MALYSLYTGKLIMRGVIKREIEPLLYWLGTIFYFISGIISAILAIDY